MSDSNNQDTSESSFNSEEEQWLEIEARRKRLEALVVELENTKDGGIFGYKWLLMPIIVGAIIGCLVGFTNTGSENQYVSKDVLSGRILTAVDNGADLRAVRNIYQNRKLKGKSIKQIFSSMEGYYNQNVPLSQVLEDLRTSMYENKELSTGKVKPDSLVIKLDQLLIEHTERNPFDALEGGQRDSFENIRLKCGADYSRIKLEVDKVAAELVTKNALVDKYLGRSETSFWVSICALIISLGFGAVQIYQNRNSKVSRIVAEALLQTKKRERSPGVSD